MMEFYILTIVAKSVILSTVMWASLSSNVREGILLKISFFGVALSCYIGIVHPTERSDAALVMSIAGVCIAMGIQRYVQKKRLFYRGGDRRQCDHTRGFAHES